MYVTGHAPLLGVESPQDGNPSHPIFEGMANMDPTSILLVDDHALLRAGMRSIIEKFKDFQLVGEAEDGREATRLVRQLKPDIVLMDISMPGLNGLDATAQILREVPTTKVVIVTMHSAEQFALQAFRIGAAGYLYKDILPVDLETALRAIRHGERWFKSAAAHVIFDDYQRLANGQASATNPANNPYSLTPRQRQILQLIAEGHSTQQIAKALFISAKTVETHRARMMERLNIHDVAGLTRAAIRMNLIADVVVPRS